MDITEAAALLGVPPEEIRIVADELLGLHDVLCELADSIENNEEGKIEPLIGKFVMLYADILQK